MSYLKDVPHLQHLISNADHFDEKMIECDLTLREFIAGFIAYNPIWIRGLYQIRAGFVRLLGMRQPQIELPQMTPEMIPFAAGENVSFFVVSEETTPSVWVASADDEHLKAYIIIAREPNSNRFYVGTVVFYHKWSGPVYFNVIRPFHHVVVRSMMQAGANYKRLAQASA